MDVDRSNLMPIAPSLEPATGDIRLPAGTWQRVAHGLFLKLAGQALAVVAAASLLVGGQVEQDVLLPLVAVLAGLALSLDVVGRLLCLAAPRTRAGRQAVIHSVAAQTLAAAVALPAFAWFLWPATTEATGLRAGLILLALLAQFTAALFFTRFLGDLALQLGLPSFAKYSQTLAVLLWLLVTVSAVGFVSVMVVAVLVFLVVTVLTLGWAWIFAAGFGFMAGAIVSFPFTCAVVVLLTLIQTCYGVIVLRLALATFRAA